MNTEFLYVTTNLLGFIPIHVVFSISYGKLLGENKLIFHRSYLLERSAIGAVNFENSVIEMEGR